MMRWTCTAIVFLAILWSSSTVHSQGYGTTGPGDSLTVTQIAPSAPAAPSGLSAQKVSDVHIKLNWSDNAINEDGFAVEAKADGEPYREVGRTEANVWEYSYFFYERYSPLTTFSFRVKALNSAGESPYSNVAEISMGPPDVPTKIRAETYSTNQVNLFWWTDALVANKDGFIIERKAQDAEFAPILKLQVKSLFPSTSEVVFECDKPCEVSGSNGVFTYPDRDLMSKTAYSYRVRAFNQAGSSVSVESVATTY